MIMIEFLEFIFRSTGMFLYSVCFIISFCALIAPYSFVRKISYNNTFQGFENLKENYRFSHICDFSNLETTFYTLLIWIISIFISIGTIFVFPLFGSHPLVTIGLLLSLTGVLVFYGKKTKTPKKSKNKRLGYNRTRFVLIVLLLMQYYLI